MRHRRNIDGQVRLADIGAEFGQVLELASESPGTPEGGAVELRAHRDDAHIGSGEV